MAGSIVGQAVIQVRPNLAPFKREVEQGVSTAGRRVKPIDVKANTKPAEAGFGRLKSLAVGIAGIFAVSKGVEFFKSSIDAASDLNESLSKTRVVFGSSSKEVERFAKNAATSLGQSRQSALESAATFGNLFTAMKLGKPQAADMSQAVVKLAGDLASFNNVRPEEAIEALRSGLVGEVEPLRRFGVNVSAAALQQKAFALGLIKTEKEALTPAAKAQAAYALIMEQTKTAQGDFLRTSSGLANQQRILSASFTDLKAKLGAALLPVVLKVVGALNTMIGFLMREAPPAFAILKAKFAELQATVAPFIARAKEVAASVREWLPSFQQVVAFLDRFKVSIAAAIATFVAFRTVVNVIQGVRAAIIALNLALAANPVVLFAIALAALAAAFVIAYQRSAEFRAFVQQALQAVQAVAQQVVTWITGTFVPALQRAFAAVATTWNQNSARIIANARSFLAFLQQVWSWFKGPATTIVRAAFTAIATIIRAQITIIQNVIQLVLNVLAGRWGAAWGNLKTIASTALRAVISVVTGLGGALLSAAVQLAGKLLQGLRSKLAEAPGVIRSLLGKLPGAVAAVGGALLSAGASIGRQLMQGVMNGVGALAGAVRSFIEKKIHDAVSSLNPFSPVAHGGLVYIGVPLMEGAMQGVAKLAPRLSSKLSGAVKDAVMQARQNLASTAGSLSSSINQLLDAKLQKGPAGSALAAAQKRQADLDFAAQKAQLEAAANDESKTADERAKAQADLDVLLAQRAYDAEKEKVDAAKAANDQKLADLSEALSRGFITQKQYQQKVIDLLKSEGVNYKAAGDTLGLAFADGFLAQLKGTLQQAQAIAKAGLPGSGFAADVTNPLATVREELRSAKGDLAQARRDARDKGGPGGKKVTAAEQRAIDHAKRQVDTLQQILNALNRIATVGLPQEVTLATAPDSWIEVAGVTTAGAAR